MKLGRSREKALLCIREDFLRGSESMWMFLGACHLLGHYYSSPRCHTLHRARGPVHSYEPVVSASSKLKFFSSWTCWAESMGTYGNCWDTCVPLY